MYNINLQITFVRRRYAVVFLFLRSLLSETMRACMLTYYDIFWPLSALTSKRRCFILAHNIRPKFGRTFGTRSVSLPKPSASAECHNLTFGPSLVLMSKRESEHSIYVMSTSNLFTNLCFVNVLVSNGERNMAQNDE